MKKRAFFTLLCLVSIPAIANETLISTQSQFSVSETANRFEKKLKEKGLTLFSRINHAENASQVDLNLRPTEIIIFGNPKVGTPLMLCSQKVAIDLPQKALFWEDASGKVWLSYNRPEFLKHRHGIKGCKSTINKIKKVLGLLSKAATSNLP